MSNETSDHRKIRKSNKHPRTIRPDNVRSERIVAAITNPRFNDWYTERQIVENILDGNLYFNGLSKPSPPEKHTPSKLLQCHRKVVYERENAPREGTQPQGLFWSGTAFEEDIIVPFLQDEVTGDSTYVQNSKWVDTTISVDGDDELRIRGVTDPVIVTKDGTPVVVTEVKTKSRLDYVDEPNQHHRAQLHAYLYALNEAFDRSVEDGVIIYGSRTTLDLEVFYVQFDDAFWNETVVPWMREQTRYRKNNELPPADAVFDWECDTCSFHHRCGQTDAPYEDMGYRGLLPDVSGYRKQQVREYLEYDDEAKLTPTLAHQYPTLTHDFDVYDWECPNCNTQVPWNEPDWEPDRNQPPVCPNCADTDSLVTMHIPLETQR